MTGPCPKLIMDERVKLVPVIVDEEVQLFDIYINVRWIGSRRTEKHSLEAAERTTASSNGSDGAAT
jgi:hypothetical protein